jgi:DNA-binding response OmpR family regulator
LVWSSRTALAAYLRECGYEVVEAGTAEEAAQALRLEMKFDLAFLDIEGNEGAGFQLAQSIRKHRPEVLVVLAAGVPRAAAEAGDLCEQGPTRRRPYDYRTLERHIRRLLAR